MTAAERASRITGRLLLAAALLLPLAPRSARADAAAEVAKARREGWDYAAIAVELLRKGDGSQLPGTKAWLVDYSRAEQQLATLPKDAPLPALDVERLVTRNPYFWAMAYEVVPGDPAFGLLHSGLLLAGGEAQRASHLVAFAHQRPGMDEIMHQALSGVLFAATNAQRPSHALVEQGIKLHDAKDFAGAVKKYDEAIAILPSDGWAHYERGFSLRAQALVAQGKPVPSSDTVTLGQVVNDPEEVRLAFARSRFHDPFQWQAWQGKESRVLRGARALIVKARPVWDELRRGLTNQIEDRQLSELAEACQAAQIDEYALFLRQMIISRRRRYEPIDNPVIADSLRRLIPGEIAESIIGKFERGTFPIRQLAPVEPGTEMQAAPQAER